MRKKGYVRSLGGIKQCTSERHVPQLLMAGASKNIKKRAWRSADSSESDGDSDEEYCPGQMQFQLQIGITLMYSYRCLTTCAAKTDDDDDDDDEASVSDSSKDTKPKPAKTRAAVTTSGAPTAIRIQVRTSAFEAHRISGSFCSGDAGCRQSRTPYTKPTQEAQVQAGRR